MPSATAHSTFFFAQLDTTASASSLPESANFWQRSSKQIRAVEQTNRPEDGKGIHRLPVFFEFSNGRSCFLPEYERNVPNEPSQLERDP